MKNRTLIKGLLVSIMFLGMCSTTYALEKYTLLAPIPGVSDPCTPDLKAQGREACQTTLETYLPGAFKLAIGIAAGMAFVVITFGGIMYATSDAISGKSEGREYIENAIWGLLLVIGAYVILNTINPKILNFNLNIEQPNIATSTPPIVTAGRNMTVAQMKESQDIARLLGQNPNPCAFGQTTNCVNFNGLGQQVIAGVNNLRSKCTGCTVAITGGTEPGHSVGSEHNYGNALDIRGDQGLNNFLIKEGRSLTPNVLKACGQYTYGTGLYLWEPKGSSCGGTVASTGDHWHVSYK